MYNCTSLNNTIHGGTEMKKRVIIIVSIVLVLIIAVIIGVVAWLSQTSGVMVDGNTACVASISEIYGLDIAFTSNRYNGVVEMQEVVNVKADSDKIIKETFVKEGDTVKKGDKLFEYDVEQMQLQLSQTQLDLDQAEAQIDLCNSQITSLESQKSSADQNELLNIQNQILTLQLEIKNAEYTVSNKTTEIDELNNDIENNVVKAEIDGKIQSIGESDTESLLINNIYITIATTDDYRIKAMVSEDNLDTFSKDAPVTMRSRQDESKTWTGKVSSIDTSKPSTGADTTGAEGVSKYPVYIELDSAEGLMIGQHVTVELNVEEGTGDGSELLLDEFYICDIDTAPYVWCRGENNLLEKRTVELGEYDEIGRKYQILSGLTKEDCIAFPEDNLTEGMTTVSMSEIIEEEAESGEVLE